MTSFKTAWLASRLPNVDKVVFLVDRIALTNQTVDAYRAYDPIAGFEGKTGVVGDTANISDLHNLLTRKSDKNIIVTSIQKMSRYITWDRFKPLKENILFIVDEAHRSTGDGTNKDGMLETIRTRIRNSAWVGYTGTPKFPETRDVFGDLIHAYTIKEAIADKNVLGFNVVFKETIEAPKDATEEDIDDMIKGSVYDTSPEHVELVVKDIFDNWKKRSNDGQYNALFTVHVGGNKASTPRAMEYFDKIIEENNKRPKNEQLIVAISFSMDTSNSESQLTTNENLHRAIQYYNKQFFDTEVFDMNSVKAYTEDLASRLNKTAYDGKYLDLVIVVDQLLTGFDAPQLNTLYVDRTLKGGNLIQAYSRTNRIHNSDAKPWGNVINYRWPEQNEYEMNKAFAVYSNRTSADEQLTLKELVEDNMESGIIAKPFNEVRDELRTVIKELSNLTDQFIQAPPSEREQDLVFDQLKKYNQLVNQLRQYTVDENGHQVSAYDNPLEFYELIGITEDQEIILTTMIADDIKRNKAIRENIDISQVNLAMVHIQEIRINYDYLIELIAKMADEVHDNRMETAAGTMKEIELEVAKSENDNEKSKVLEFIGKIFNKEFTFDRYPAPRDAEAMNQAMDRMRHDDNITKITEFIRKWGLDNSILPRDLSELIQKHRVGQEDLDKQGELNTIINEAKADYKYIAEDSVKSLSWVRYRIDIRTAIYELADDIKKND